MGDHIARGEDFEKKAEKKLTGWGIFGNKHEDAAELYEKAANSYKLGKSCTLLFSLSIIDFFFLMCFWLIRRYDG